VAGLSTPETLVVRSRTGTVAAAVRSLGELDDHAATEETHPVTVLDGILGVTGILVLDKTIAFTKSVRQKSHDLLSGTSLDITTDDATILDEDILKLADTSVHGDSANEKSHLKEIQASGGGEY
jgi:hypothetical protein